MNKVVKIVLIVIAVLAVLYGLLLAATHLTDQSYTDTRYDSDGNVIGEIKYSFEVKNLLIEKRMDYELEYKPGTDKIIKAVDYVYWFDNPGVLSHRETYTFSEEFPPKVYPYCFRKRYPYSTVSREEFDGNGAFTYTAVSEYNENGDLINERLFDSTGELSSRATFEYDQNGDLIIKRLFDKLDELSSYFTFEYNENGDIIKECEFDNQDNLTETVIYEYNDEGKVTKKETLDGEGKLQKYQTYTYIEEESRQGTQVDFYDSEDNLLDSIFTGTSFDSVEV